MPIHVLFYLQYISWIAILKYFFSQEAAEAAKKKGKILRPGLPPVMIFWKQRRRSAASGIICFFLFNLHDILFTKVRKGIFRIQDLTKMRCGIRQNAKYLYGKRDLTASAKWDSTPEFGHGMQDFFACLKGIWHLCSCGKCEVQQASIQWCFL